MSVNSVLAFLNSVAISGFRDGIVNYFLHLCDRKLSKSTFSVTFPTELSHTTEIMIMIMRTMIMMMMIMMMMLIMIMIKIMIHLLKIFVLKI